MDVDEDVLTVLSADEACFLRTAQLFPGRHAPRVEWVYDPMALARAAKSGSRLGTAAAIVDLASAVDWMPDASRGRVSGESANANATTWLLAVAVVVHRGIGALLVVSDDQSLEPVIELIFPPAAKRLDPNDDDVTWRHAIIWAMSRGGKGSEWHDGESAEGTRSIVTGGSQAKRGCEAIAVDFDRQLLLTPRGCIVLSAREARVLELLSDHPGRFHSLTELAARVTMSSRYPADEHCIRQTIYKLRRKLSATCCASPIVVSRRGLGYSLAIAQPQT